MQGLTQQVLNECWAFTQQLLGECRVFTPQALGELECRAFQVTPQVLGCKGVLAAVCRAACKGVQGEENNLNVYMNVIII